MKSAKHALAVAFGLMARTQRAAKASQLSSCGMKKPIYSLVLMIVILAVPGRSRADTFTFSLNANPQQGDVLSFQLSTLGGPPPAPTTNELTIVTPLSDPLVAVLIEDVKTATLINSVIIDAFKTVNGVPTLGETLEFDKDIIASLVTSSIGGNPVEKVTFNYEKETTTIIGGGGGGGGGTTPTPEPSSLILLSTGVAAVLACSRLRKQAAATHA